MTYYKQLDSLRAIAIISVIIEHWIPEGHILKSFNIPWGMLGVNMFFVLSGFLITGIIVDSKSRIESGTRSISETFKIFFARRSLRLFPAFYFTIAFAYFSNEKLIKETVLWHFFYMTNFYHFILGKWSGSLTHLWTLAVEEQFYFIWFWILILIPNRYFMKLFVGSIVLALSFKHFMSGGNVKSFAQYLTPSCFDSFAIGAILSYGGKAGLKIEKIFNGTSFSLAFLLFVFTYFFPLSPIFLGFQAVFSRTLVSFMSACIIQGAVLEYTGFFGSILNNSILINIGKISYGMYLYHNFMVHHYYKLMPGFANYYIGRISEDVKYLIMFFALYILSFLSMRYLEKPFTNLKSKFQ